MPIPQEDRLATLHEAYLWEQNRIKAWVDDLNNHRVDANPMIARFYTTWIAYFNEVTASNAWVIGVCDTALVEARKRSDPKEQAAILNPAIRSINRIEHRKGSVSAISNAANIYRHQSKYFKSLDAVIDLENEVRDYIEDYLVDGKP